MKGNVTRELFAHYTFLIGNFWKNFVVKIYFQTFFFLIAHIL